MKAVSVDPSSHALLRLLFLSSSPIDFYNIVDWYCNCENVSEQHRILPEMTWDLEDNLWE